MGRQRETTINVSRKEDALTLLRQRLGLVAKKPPGFVGNQAPYSQILHILQLNRGANPVALDPAGRQAGPRGRSPRLVFLPFGFPAAVTVAFLAHSRAAVLSFPIAADYSRVVRRCREGRRMR